MFFPHSLVLTDERNRKYCPARLELVTSFLKFELKIWVIMLKQKLTVSVIPILRWRSLGQSADAHSSATADTWLYGTMSKDSGPQSEVSILHTSPSSIIYAVMSHRCDEQHAYSSTSQPSQVICSSSHYLFVLTQIFNGSDRLHLAFYENLSKPCAGHLCNNYVSQQKLFLKKKKNSCIAVKICTSLRFKIALE